MNPFGSTNDSPFQHSGLEFYSKPVLNQLTFLTFKRTKKCFTLKSLQSKQRPVTPINIKCINQIILNISLP